jgi:hypothetical protein
VPADVSDDADLGFVLGDLNLPREICVLATPGAERALVDAGVTRASSQGIAGPEGLEHALRADLTELRPTTASIARHNWDAKRPRGARSYSQRAKRPS